MNNITRTACALGISIGAILPIESYAAEIEEAIEEAIEEVMVWGSRHPMAKTRDLPNRTLTPEDLASINVTSAEDLLKFEPGLIIRKRFIGDANGTIGIRGANMFQTTRSMVFADGVPLHYFLQTRFSGSPRWSLVSSDEIAEVNISYGPFSAQYPGNAMGGVINIETAIPEQRKFHTDVSTFLQNSSRSGNDEDLIGYKGFVSYADKIGDLGIFVSFNHLENEGHAQSDYFSTNKTVPVNIQAISVQGANIDTNEYGEVASYYGSGGIADVSADQLKLKLSYDRGSWLSIVNFAFEDRVSQNSDVKNFIRDENGEVLWQGWAVQNGINFEVEHDDFSLGKSERQSMLVGGRSRGQLGKDFYLEVSASYFEILKDESYETNAHPLDPVFQPGYNLSREYGDTGWLTADVKLLKESWLGIAGLDLSTGLHHDQYALEILSSSGGKTETSAAFIEMDYALSSSLRVLLGGRFEQWQSEDGFYISRGTLEEHPDRDMSRFSPKFSITYVADVWQINYALARAFRFPIVEELFQNERTTRSRSVANANLGPEDGVHQNLGFTRALYKGDLTLNFFKEKIDDTIYSQTGMVGGTSLRTFLPVDQVETQGFDLSINQFGLLNGAVDLRFNLSYLDAEITKNAPNPDIEGKVFPRMPKWRANLLLNWHVTERWNLGAGLRYASNSYGDLDNADTARQVFGAHDKFTFLNLKTSYALSQAIKVSLGIDNVTNVDAYVHHPWPQRTAFLQLSVDY